MFKLDGSMGSLRKRDGPTVAATGTPKQIDTFGLNRTNPRMKTVFNVFIFDLITEL